MRSRYFLPTLMLVLAGQMLYAQATVTLEKLGTYTTGVFDQGAAEIAVYDSAGRHVYFTNADANMLTILSVDNQGMLTKVKDVALDSFGGGVNSVAAYNGLIAVAVEADDAQDSGKVVFFDRNGNYLNDVMVGAMPDMLTFNRNGEYLLTANEGEPNDAYTVDPEGSVSIIDVRGGAAGLTQGNVRHATFTHYDSVPIDPLIRIYGPNAKVSQDLEPEYITISPDNTRAYVTLQENNAIATVDIGTASILSIRSLGYKDFSEDGNGIDASDRSNNIDITTVPVYGLYMPDAIAAFSRNGTTYLVTANEGDARDYDGFSEEERIANLTLNDAVFPNASALQTEAQIGRLNVTTTMGDTNTDGSYEQLFAPGARSFSIWNAGNGQLVYDSGDDFEQYLASRSDATFNSDNTDNNSRKSRSDNKGPEPEAAAVAMIDTNIYAFIGLERQGGIFMFDVTNPEKPTLMTYSNNRNFGAAANSAGAGDLGIESIQYVPANMSPTGDHLLVTAHEVSGTVTLYKIANLPIGIAPKTFARSSWNVYPNPMGQTNVLNLSVQGTYRLMDAQGRLLRIYPNTQSLDMSGFGRGTYLIQDTDGRVAVVVR